MLDRHGARTSHRADQAPKPVTAVLLPKPGLKERKNKKTTLSQRALDKFGFIEAWAKLSQRFALFHLSRSRPEIRQASGLSSLTPSEFANQTMNQVMRV
jgi:hypothetical protein